MVRKSLDQLVKVRINPEDGSREAELARQYDVTGYPRVVVVGAGPARRAARRGSLSGLNASQMTPGLGSSVFGHVP